MSSSEEENHHDNSSQCPECKKKYISSSQAEQQKSSQDSKQRIVIPLRKDLLSSPSNDQIHQTLRTLQAQIQSLKRSNTQKDKMIDDLKREMQHKITHYMMYGEINKQADQINRIRSQIAFGYGSGVRGSRKAGEIDDDRIRMIVKEQSRKFVERPLQDFRGYQRNQSHGKSKRRKAHSTHDNYSALRRQLMGSKNDSNIDRQPIEVSKQYFEKSTAKTLFNVSQAKNKLKEYEQRIRGYEKQLHWMTNFVTTFVKTMKNLAFKKYSEQIIIPEWSLKKKAKTSWRYMKHVFSFLYSEPVL